MAGKSSDFGGALEPLLEGDGLRAAFRRRRDEDDYAKIPFDQEGKFAQAGWTVHKRTQSHLWVKTQKHPEALLEDRVWCLLYRMGYPRLSGPKFSVTLQSGGSDAKRISVMAIDDETAIVVECRATRTEADLFITINHEQKSVSKSLLVTLQADLKLGSGDPREAISALASSLVRIVNNDNASPFFRRFEIPGIAAADSQNLTIAEAVKGLVRSNLFGSAISKRSRVPGYFSGQTDEETLVRGRKIVNGYFRPIMDANPSRWEKGRTAYICVNPGIRAHFQLMQEILRFLAGRGDFDPNVESPEKIIAALSTFIEPILTFVADAPEKQILTNFSRKFGDGGVREYFYNLCEIVQKRHKDFGGEDFKKYKAHAADARVQQADEDTCGAPMRSCLTALLS